VNILTQEQNSMPVIRARMLTAMGLLNTKQPDIGSVLNARLGRSILKTVTTGEKGGWDEDNKRSRMYQMQQANQRGDLYR